MRSATLEVNDIIKYVYAKRDRVEQLKKEAAEMANDLNIKLLELSHLGDKLCVDVDSGDFSVEINDVGYIVEGQVIRLCKETHKKEYL